MPYVKGNALDGRSRVAQISQNRDQVTEGIRFPGSGLTPNRNYDFPLPVGWVSQKNAQQLQASRSNDLGQVSWQFQFPPASWNFTMSAPDWTPPVGLAVKERARQTIAATAQDGTDWKKFFPTPTIVIEPFSDFPNPVVRPLRAYPIFDAGYQPNPTGIFVPLPQSDFPNPTKLIPRAVSLHDVMPQYFTTGVMAAFGTVYELPTTRPPRSFPNYDAGFQPPTLFDSLRGPIPDQPNPQQPRRGISVSDSGLQAPLSGSVLVLPPSDFPNPNRISLLLYPLYDPGRAIIWTPAPGIMPLMGPIDWQNPTRLRPFTFALYDPGQTGLSPQIPPIVVNSPYNSLILLGT